MMKACSRSASTQRHDFRSAPRAPIISQFAIDDRIQPRRKASGASEPALPKLSDRIGQDLLGYIAAVILRHTSFPSDGLNTSAKPLIETMSGVFVTGLYRGGKISVGVAAHRNATTLTSRTGQRTDRKNSRAWR